MLDYDFDTVPSVCVCVYPNLITFFPSSYLVAHIMWDFCNYSVKFVLGEMSC